MMSATCGKPSVRSRWRARVRRERGQRILALDPTVGEVVRAAGAEGDGAVLGRADQEPADVRVLAQRRDQLRVALARAPRASAGALPPSGRRARGCPSRGRRPVDPRRRSWAASPPCARSPRSSACPTIALCSSPPANSATSPPASDALDQLVEAVAVALLEGRALGLAVIGEHDDLVGAAARSGAPARSGRTAGRACAGPPSCRPARGPSGARPRRSSRRSRRRRGARASCR